MLTINTHDLKIDMTSTLISLYKQVFQSQFTFPSYIIKTFSQR